MGKMIRWLKGLSIQRKALLYLLCLLMVGTGVLTGTQAWQSLGQNALNMGSSNGNGNEIYLLKLERDKDGEETSTPIKGAKFYLYQVGKKKDIQIGSSYLTNDTGKISVKLSPGEYYFEEAEPSTGYTFDKDKKGQAIKRYPFTVTPVSSNEYPIVTAYNQHQVGNLEIIKEIVNSDGSEVTAKQKKETFKFQVTFSDKGNYSYRIDGGDQRVLKNGEMLILTDGQKASFERLPVGVHYAVTEIATKEYETSATNSSGNITEDISVVRFVNTFSPKKGNLEISKKVMNEDGSDLTAAQKRKNFEFEVAFSNLSDNYAYSTTTGRKGTLKSGDTFTLMHDEVLTFLQLPIGLEYVIGEKESKEYTSSPSAYSGTVRSTESVRLPFINQYRTSHVEKGSLRFGKQVIANQINKEQQFSFVLTFSDGGTHEYQVGEGEKQLHKSGEKINITHGESIHFPELPSGISFHIKEESKEGYQAQLEEVHGFILSNHEAQFTFHNHKDETMQLVLQKNGEGEGFDFSKVFLFKVWINGKLLSEPIQLKAGEKSEPIKLAIGDTWNIMEENTFDEGYSQQSLVNGTGVATTPNQTITVTQKNTYIGKPMTQLIGLKTWSVPEGHSHILPERIKVRLKDGETTVATQDVLGPEWRYQFDVPKYNAQGEEITYTIEEEPVPNFRPIYQVNSINIENVYITPVTSKKLLVEKKLTGDKPNRKEMFEFRMEPGQQLIKIEGEGKNSFEPLTFKQPGTYTYTITERNKGTVGYTYDSSVYTWKVIVEEKDNRLVIVSEQLQKNNKMYDKAIVKFENSFNTKQLIHETIKINGMKTWVHQNQAKEKQPQKITVLLRANGKIVYRKVVGKEDDWHYSFTVNSHDAEGKKIKYSIDEEDIPEYKKTVEGFNLTNTYTKTINKVPTKQGNPKQSLSKKFPLLPQLWEEGLNSFAMIGLLVLMVGLTIVLVKKERKNR